MPEDGDAAAPTRTPPRPRPIPRWYRHVPPARLTVVCDAGTEHVVQWRRGRLVLLNHDVGAEIALGALGGERPACLAVLEQWRDACRDGPPRRAGVVRPSAAVREEVWRRADLAHLVRTERRWSDPALPEDGRRAMLRRLVDGVRDAVAASLAPSARARGRQRVEVAVTPVATGERPAVRAAGEPGRLRLALGLPLSWLVAVGGRGLGEVPDLVVLEVADADTIGGSGALGVTALRWSVPRPGRAVPRLDRLWLAAAPAGGWRPVEGRRAVRAGPDPWWSVNIR